MYLVGVIDHAGMQTSELLNTEKNIMALLSELQSGQLIHACCSMSRLWDGISVHAKQLWVHTTTNHSQAANQGDMHQPERSLDSYERSPGIRPITWLIA